MGLAALQLTARLQLLKILGRRTAFVLLEVAREVGLRREAQALGNVFEGTMGGGEQRGDLADDALVDDGFGRAVDGATRHLPQVAGADIKLFGIESHVGIAVEIALDSG